MIHRLVREQVLGGDPGKIWDFFGDPKNLDLLTPPTLSFKIINEVDSSMYAGQMIEYRIGILPGVTTRWLTEITHVCAGEFFVDEQRRGPYRLWHHEHRFEKLRDGAGVRMRDCVTYEVGWSLLGEGLHALWIRRQLRTIFDFRAQKIAQMFPVNFQ